MKKSNRILFSILFMIILSVLSAAISVSAEEYSGECGDTLTWSIDTSTGVLEITGTGDMYDYSFAQNGVVSRTSAPWGEYASYIESVIIGNDVGYIGDYAFYKCNAMTSVTIGDSVAEIGDYAFQDCSKLTDAAIPDSVAAIGNYAFNSCSSMVSITIGNGVTRIGEYAFRNCGRITSVVIPDSVKSIGALAFSYCSKLTSITIGDNVTRLGADAFLDTAFYKDSSNWENDVLYIGKYLIEAKTSLSGAYTVKSGTTCIGDDAFYNCKSLSGISIPDSVTALGHRAFYNCTSISNIAVPNRVESIGYRTFYRCISLSRARLPYCVTSISDDAFEGCRSFKIECVKGSYAESYAKDNSISVIYYECTECVFTKYYSDNNGTCTEDGTMTAYCDNGCGGKSTIVQENSKKHSYRTTNILKEATCSTEGLGEQICTLCGDYNTYSISPINHDFKEYINNNDATCTANGTKTAYCSFGYGSYDIVIIPDTAMGHSLGEYIYNKDATCLTDGTKTSKCIRCDVTDTLPAEGSVLGHTFGKYESNKDATCTNDGTESAKCVRCDITDTRTAENSAIGHSFTNYINDGNTGCIHDGTKTAICDNGCGACDTVMIEGSAYGHCFTDYIFNNDATCIENGTETAICDNGCGVSDTRMVEGSALGHSYTNYVIISELSCTVNGVKEAYCDNGCGEKDVITDEAQGHISSEWIVIEEADYYNDGYKIINCTVCSEVLETEIIPMLVYKGFPDVWNNSWYSEGIEYCFKHGYILGTDEGIFMPNATLTREQFVVILARISGAKLSEYTESTFTDVEADSWYGASVIWASEEGIVQGIGNELFGVGQPLSREQLAVMLYRYAEKQGRDTTEKADLSFCDDTEEISEWALDASAWAIKAGLLGSTSETANLLSPQMTVTRAQAARIFMSYDKIMLSK